MPTVPDLLVRLEQLARGEICHLAFDGDGTLWSGDVSDDVFLAACRSNWMQEAIRPPLSCILSAHGISTDGSVSELSLRLFDAEKLGQVEERCLFEVMTWCYAGRSVEELTQFAHRILAEGGIQSRIRHAARPILDWARAAGHVCWLVTASPWPIVRVAATTLGFDDDHIIAARAVESQLGLIDTGVASPIPYREQKLVQLNTRRQQSRLLAAFGDSAFDLELLQAAELAVAVNPKPALTRLLHSLSRAVVLDL